MLLRFVVATIAIGAIGFAGLAGEARACSCDGGVVRRVLPDPEVVAGEDAAIVVESDGYGANDGIDLEIVVDGVAIVDDAGAFDHAVFAAASARIDVFRPLAPWSPGPHAIEVRLVHEEVGSLDERTFSFTSDSSRAEVAPVPVVNRVEQQAFRVEGPCGGDDLTLFELFAAAADLPLVAVLDREGPDDAGGAVDVIGGRIGVGGFCGARDERFDFGAGFDVRFGHIGADGSVRFADVVEVAFPLDTDGDGRSDADDPCPDAAGPVVADDRGVTGGCPPEASASCGAVGPLPLPVLLALLVRQRRRRPAKQRGT